MFVNKFCPVFLVTCHRPLHQYIADILSRQSFSSPFIFYSSLRCILSLYYLEFVLNARTISTVAHFFKKIDSTSNYSLSLSLLTLFLLVIPSLLKYFISIKANETKTMHVTFVLSRDTYPPVKLPITTSRR